MTRPQYNFVGFSADSSSLQAGSQRDYRIGRDYKPDITESEIDGYTTLRPFPIALIRGSDQWGVAFPAGSIGVVYGVALRNPPSATIEQSWVAWWDSLFESGGIQVVPSVLPAGYAPRHENDWHSTSLGIPADGGDYPIMNASGFDMCNWSPSGSPNGIATGANAPDNFDCDFVGNFKMGTFFGGTVGYRKAQFRIAYIDGAIGAGCTFVGSFRVTISHNADGSTLTNAYDLGDTIDYVKDFVSGDFTGPPGFPFSTIFTPYYDIGALQNTIGVLTTWYIQFDFTNTVGWLSFVRAFGGGGALDPVNDTFGFDSRLSPRLDIPLPFTCTSPPNLVAPGGLVT